MGIVERLSFCTKRRRRVKLVRVETRVGVTHVVSRTSVVPVLRYITFRDL